MTMTGTGAEAGVRLGPLPDLDAKVRFLSAPSAYAERPARVEVIETHVSWVFLAGGFAYKLKKPVAFAWLDLTSLAARARNAEQEIRLNRRLSTGVYLGRVALTADAHGALSLGGAGTVVDWLVRMRRLPASRMLDACIRAGTVTRDDIAGVVAVLAAFHRRCEPIAADGVAHVDRHRRAIDDNLRALEDPAIDVADDRAAQVARSQHALLADAAAVIERRLREGRVLEGHGDLRPEHVCLESPPQVIDCLEFSRELRILDVAEELAYLGMECEALGAAWIPPLLLDAYAAQSGDAIPVPLFHFHASMRAMVRARLAAWHLADVRVADKSTWKAKAAAYVALAQRHADACDRRALASAG